MPNIRESIDEMIEESYLRGLTENEIKADLERFIEICGKVIHENVHDRKQMQKLTEKLARARAVSLIEEHHTPGETDVPFLPEDPSSKPARFAEKVARNKRLILRTIRECDPRLEQLIDQERFSGQVPEQFSQSLPLTDTASPGRAKDLFLKTCYAVTLLFILLLVYLVLLQNV